MMDTLTSETNHHRSSEGLEIETKFAANYGQVRVLVAVVVFHPSVNEATAVSKALHRRIKYVIEETL